MKKFIVTITFCLLATQAIANEYCDVMAKMAYAIAEVRDSGVPAKTLAINLGLKNDAESLTTLRVIRLVYEYHTLSPTKISTLTRKACVGTEL